MFQKPFGTGGRQVAAIGQGTWPVPDLEALRNGISLGLTHIDTAEMYGDGESEEIVGKAMAGVPRESLFVVTKVLPRNASAKGVARACERSLRRLRTEYVDCYLIHWRGDVPIEETMGALERLIEDGKTRAIGVSNFDTWDLREASAALSSRRIACDQVLYNLLERTVEDHEVPWAREYGCAIVAYTPLGQPAIDASSKGYRVLAEIGRAHGVTAHAVALAFLILDPIVFAIPKASKIEHVEANARAGGLELTRDEIDAIEGAFPKRKRVGPLPTN
jgi:diketogulonate reductase-like aldo/keto reductase